MQGVRFERIRTLVREARTVHFESVRRCFREMLEPVKQAARGLTFVVEQVVDVAGPWCALDDASPGRRSAAAGVKAGGTVRMAGAVPPPPPCARQGVKPEETNTNAAKIKQDTPRIVFSFPGFRVMPRVLCSRRGSYAGQPDWVRGLSRHVESAGREIVRVRFPLQVWAHGVRMYRSAIAAFRRRQGVPRLAPRHGHHDDDASDPQCNSDHRPILLDWTPFRFTRASRESNIPPQFRPVQGDRQTH